MKDLYDKPLHKICCSRLNQWIPVFWACDPLAVSSQGLLSHFRHQCVVSRSIKEALPLKLRWFRLSNCSMSKEVKFSNIYHLKMKTD